MKNRLKSLTAQFSKVGIDALLIIQDDNIRYLTGFSSCDSWLLVTKRKAYYITDFRYMEQVRENLKSIILHDHNGRLVQSVFELAKLDRCKNIGYDESTVNLLLFKQFKKLSLQGQKLVSANGLVERLRVFKEKIEIKQIKKALKIHQQALKYLKRIMRPGMTERQIYFKLYQFVQEQKVGFAFDPIIAAGLNSSYPHAQISDKKIKKNDIVMVDFGIEVNGYKSDLTRMFYFGKISKLIDNISTYVATAQCEAIKKIADGVPVKTVDLAARNYLASKDLDQYFGHALGHGVGLQIHEAPRLSQKSEEILRSGMIITVEPAVYLPNKFGVRLEEMVLVTKKGCEVISDHID